MGAHAKGRARGAGDRPSKWGFLPRHVSTMAAPSCMLASPQPWQEETRFRIGWPWFGKGGSGFAVMTVDENHN